MITKEYISCRTYILLFYAGEQDILLAAKTILLIFEAASGFKINFYKSSIYYLTMIDEEALKFTSRLNCKKKNLSFIYLGLPLYWRKISKQCWLPLIEKMSTRLISWKGRLLSWDGRFTLINFVLLTILLYYILVFILPSWIIKNIDNMRRVFLCKRSDSIINFHGLVKWEVVCKSNDQDGLDHCLLSIVVPIVLISFVRESLMWNMNSCFQNHDVGIDVVRERRRRK